jgi:hypothetical protein
VAKRVVGQVELTAFECGPGNVVLDQVPLPEISPKSAPFEHPIVAIDLGDQVCKFAGNSDPLRGIFASNSDPF